jgi:hypothetical protein
MFQIKVAEQIKTHILCSITFFPKTARFLDKGEKYGGATEVTNDVYNMAHAPCVLD